MRSRPTAHVKPRWTTRREFLCVDRIVGTQPQRLRKRIITARTADMAEPSFALTLPDMALGSVEGILLGENSSKNLSVSPWLSRGPQGCTPTPQLREE